MQFSFYFYYLWWLGLKKIYKAMVDCQLNLDGWLEDVTLFPTEPNDYNFNFDDLLNNGKANNEVPLDVDLPDLRWLDEKINLSIFDDPKNLPIQPNETELLMLDDAASLFLDLIDSNLDTCYLSPNDSKVKSTDIVHADANNIQEYQVSSSACSNLPLPSPCYESISEAGSPASFFSDVPAGSTSEQFCPSPQSVSSYSSSDSVNSDVSPVSVTICSMDSTSDNIPAEETLSFDEVTSSVRKRKYVNNGQEIPKIHVSLKNAFHPYSKAAPRRKGERFERKKVQNKEAAARYRIKKRTEEKVLSSVVTDLEVQQKKLKDKHNDLLTEIKYLKSLMREMLQKKGVL